MINQQDRLYEFVFKGLLADEALDRAGRQSKNLTGYLDVEVARVLSVELLDEQLVLSAKRMAAIYTAIAAFENSVRKLILTLLLEEVGESWWEKCVSERIRKKAETRRREEEKIRWHTQRGQDLLNYTELGDLANIIRNNWDRFEPYIRSAEWATSLFDVIERSRNVIMHSGTLDMRDIERIGINIRDWIKQVGS